MDYAKNVIIINEVKKLDLCLILDSVGASWCHAKGVSEVTRPWSRAGGRTSCEWSWASRLLSSFYTSGSKDSGRGLELHPFINIPLSVCVTCVHTYVYTLCTRVYVCACIHIHAHTAVPSPGTGEMRSWPHSHLCVFGVWGPLEQSGWAGQEGSQGGGAEVGALRGLGHGEMEGAFWGGGGQLELQAVVAEAAVGLLSGCM